MRRVILFIFLFAFSSPVLASSDIPDANQIEVRYIGNVSLEQLSTGAAGEGVLIYYLQQYGIDHPSLVVSLSKQPGAELAVAKVYDAPSDLNYVPIEISDRTITWAQTLTPTIIIKALGGWWVRDGLVNYNLDVQVNGPVYAMWGGGYDPKTGPTGWTALVKPGEPAVGIKVRDPDREGVPHWEVRSRLVSFPDRADISTNYAERKCRTPLEINKGLSSLWPFVAQSGGYEQPNGKLRPPIVVDWTKSKITQFSEFVTVRNQNCSYSLYSLTSLVPGKTNQLDFETPFAFYDLSGQGKGYPNLVLRTERFAAGDPLSVGLDPDIQEGRPAPRDFETVRYSWRNAVGDSLWDYKIEVMGFHPYTFSTPIAGDSSVIDAPSYEQFPQWVIKRDWPVVTFIDTEGNSYASSEGIYDWSPREVGVGYVFGWTATSNAWAFSDIQHGFRGEYRFRHNLPPGLYLSPIDNRLHLLNAEGGLWNIGNGSVLREHNLDHGPYINGWTREHIISKSTNPSIRSQATIPSEVDEALYTLAGHLIYSGSKGVEVRKVAYQLSSFEILPPTDNTSWQLFRERLAPFVDLKRNPNDLRSWLDFFPGKGVTITGAQIADVRATLNGFRFVLDLQPDFHILQNDLLDAPALVPGRYVVMYNGQFTFKPLTLPALSVTLRHPTLTQLEPGTIQVSLRNDGLEDAPEATLELLATSPKGFSKVVATQNIQLLAQEPVTLNLAWAPPSSGTWVLTPRIRQADGHLISGNPTSVEVAPSENKNPLRLLLVSVPLTRLPILVIGLILLAMPTALVFWHEWAKPLMRKENDQAQSLDLKEKKNKELTCPNCQTREKQRKAGFNRSGSQRYRCGDCSRVYTPKPKPHGYSVETRMLAISMYEGGNSYKAIGRVLKVSPQSVANWTKQYASQLSVPANFSTPEVAVSYRFLVEKNESYLRELE